MSRILSITLLIALGVLGSCKGPMHAGGAGSVSPAPPPPTVVAGPAAQGRIIGGTPIPRAVAYRTDGDYADRVPVTLTSTGTLASYPAPSDVCGSEPLPLADGYLLDRRGVGENTVFTRYTYAGYCALSEAPSPEAIMGSIIPGAHVTAIVTLPMTLQEALADTAAVNRYLRNL